MAGNRWRTRLTARAESDLLEITTWTTDKFGPAQARKYRDVIFAAMHVLDRGPAALGVRSRDDIRPWLMSLHIAREGRSGRHYLVFRVKSDSERVIEVLRILYDQMDLAHHIPRAE